MLRKIPEERRTHLRLGESLKSAPKSPEYVNVRRLEL